MASHPYPAKRRDRARGWKTGEPFDHLAEMGVKTQSAMATWTGYWWEDETAGSKPWPQRAVRLNWDEADILLWNQIAHDLDIRPQASVLSKFVDLDRAVSVHAYDDRGLDITALDAETIRDIYRRFDPWLLDYDRPRMADAFRV